MIYVDKRILGTLKIVFVICFCILLVEVLYLTYVSFFREKKSIYFDGINAVEINKNNDYVTEYYVIRAMADFLKGIDWLKKIDSEKYHIRLRKMKGNKYKNAIAWRLVEIKYKRKYEI